MEKKDHQDPKIWKEFETKGKEGFLLLIKELEKFCQKTKRKAYLSRAISSKSSYDFGPLKDPDCGEPKQQLSYGIFISPPHKTPLVHPFLEVSYPLIEGSDHTPLILKVPFHLFQKKAWVNQIAH